MRVFPAGVSAALLPVPPGARGQCQPPWGPDETASRRREEGPLSFQGEHFPGQQETPAPRQ